eukprot:5795548-Pleurochrysis_carterae.AAC.1
MAGAKAGKPAASRSRKDSSSSASGGKVLASTAKGGKAVALRAGTSSRGRSVKVAASESVSGRKTRGALTLTRTAAHIALSEANVCCKHLKEQTYALDYEADV